MKYVYSVRDRAQAYPLFTYLCETQLPHRKTYKTTIGDKSWMLPSWRVPDSEKRQGVTVTQVEASVASKWKMVTTSSFVAGEPIALIKQDAVVTELIIHGDFALNTLLFMDSDIKSALERIA